MLYQLTFLRGCSIQYLPIDHKMQLQQQLASRQAAKASTKMAAPVAAPLASRAMHARAPSSKQVAASLQHVAGATQQKQRASGIAQALGNGVSAPGPASPLSIVFVSAEVSPWSKTGGLGDVVGGLPVELAKRCEYLERWRQRW